MSPHLTNQTLAAINADRKPGYPGNSIQNGIVHLGIGGFHRAHQAVYTDDLLAKGHTDWGIIGVSLRSDKVQTLLAPQDYLYTVIESHQQATSTRVVGSIDRVLALSKPGGREQILAAIADPATQVVSLTITEKGYCHQSDGTLDADNPGILWDLAHPQEPTSAPGLLAQALNQRMRAKAGPLTILSCDNLSSNGKVTRKVVEEMVRLQYPSASGWVRDNVRFPSSMVDRIVPQTTTEDIQQLQLQRGYIDDALIVCEPFSQWIIEDDFAGLRPAWDLVGAQFVQNVAPYEQTKLRFLNATHSALAYLGLLCGYRYIDQSIADSTLQQFAKYLMDIEIEPTVDCPQDFNLPQYKASILARFANSQVRYKTTQVATDGSLKLPQRILPSVAGQRSLGKSSPGLCLVIAAWLECVAGSKPEDDAAYFSDPMADQLQALASGHTQPDALISAVAEQTSFFGELSRSEGVLGSVADALSDLRSKGGLDSVKAILNL